MATTSPILELTMYRMNCFVLAYMDRPSATADTAGQVPSATPDSFHVHPRT